MCKIRKLYYRIISRLSEIEIPKDFTGFGLYDKTIIDAMRKISNTYPYFRGLIGDIGYEIAKIEYTQRARISRITTKQFLYPL